MNIPHIIISGIIAILFTFNVQAYSDLNKEFCKNTKYLNCLNSTTKKCMAAYLQSQAVCLKNIPVTTDEDSNNNHAAAKKYGECFTSEYLNAFNVDSTKFESCATHLEPLLDEQLEKYKEQLKISKEKFHKQ